MNETWDGTGAAGAALAQVVEGFGVPVLGRPDMFRGLLEDDVPHLEREVDMLTKAATFGVADRLTERVQEGIAADAAVRMVATGMTAPLALPASRAHWPAT